MTLSEHTVHLVNSIKKTKAFIQLKQAKAELDKNQGLKRQIEELQQKQMELLSQKPSNQIKTEMMQIKKAFDSLSKKPEVNQFLKASHEFNELMAKTYRFIDESIDASLK